MFRDAPEYRQGVTRPIHGSSFFDFLREVPLDEEATVDFPGGAEVWMVAKGTSASTQKVGKLLKKARKAVAPEVEDEILLRLAQTRYTSANIHRTELENFLAVSRIDRHRPEPLDEASALTLAQHYSEYNGVYPYFAVLNGLSFADFRQFFEFGASVAQGDKLQLNGKLGQWHALVAILCLAQEGGEIDGAHAAALFRSITTQFTRAASADQWTAAALEGIREIIKAARSASAGADADESVRTLVLGSVAPVSFRRGTTQYALDPGSIRRQEYARVLEAQKVAPLGPLLRIYDAARRIAAGKAPLKASIDEADACRAQLLVVEVPKAVKAEGKQKANLYAYSPEAPARAITNLRKKTAKKKINPKDLAHAAEDLIEAIEPQVRWTLDGIVYAAYLRPDDLLVSDDPLFLRKHEFVQLDWNATNLFGATELIVSSAGTGSHFQGGFATLSREAGKVAAIGGNSATGAAEHVVAAQLAALRATDYRKLTEADMHVLALTIRAAREWVVESAVNEKARFDLADSTLGLLSPRRRRDLLNGVSAADWGPVWDSLTLSDLYFLGRRYQARYSADRWPSPVLAELRRLTANNQGERLNVFGAVLSYTQGCSHPHLIEQPAYEEYERAMFPTSMAERVAEFKLYLAERMEAAGLPASVFPMIAEPVAKRVLKGLKMADTHDWHSAIRAFSDQPDGWLEEALPKQ